MDKDYSDETSKKKFLGKIDLLSLVVYLSLVYIGFLLYQVINLNYQTNQKILSLKEEIKEIEQDQGDLEALIAYYQTPAFQELEARKKLGMKKPGERVMTVEVKTNSHSSSRDQSKDEDAQESVPNYQKWIDFICGREV